MEHNHARLSLAFLPISLVNPTFRQSPILLYMINCIFVSISGKQIKIIYYNSKYNFILCLIQRLLYSVYLLLAGTKTGSNHCGQVRVKVLPLPSGIGER
jgi:hypothetical protein